MATDDQRSVYLVQAEGDDAASGPADFGDVAELRRTQGRNCLEAAAKAGAPRLAAVGGTTSVPDTVADYAEVEQIICFTPGTMIRTMGGPRAIETLVPGDMVLTRDSGLQPIRWIGTSTVAGTGAFAPVRLRKGAVPDLNADLIVSAQHRMLVEGYRAELLFGEREVLAAARDLGDGTFIAVEEVEQITYIHMLFDEHEIIFANGAATESYHPASYGLEGISEAAREELFGIFPQLRATPERYGKTARRVLKAYEARALAW